MKVVMCLFAIMAVAMALPQNTREGAAFSNEAIRQAQQSFLIPRDATIQKVTNIFAYLYHSLKFIIA